MERTRFRFLFVSSALLCSLVAFAQQYVVTDLGTLAPDSFATEANAVNSLGQIVGDSSVNGQPHAFLWSQGTMRSWASCPA